jgi:hypothetical protein
MDPETGMIHSSALARETAVFAQAPRWIASLLALVICCLTAAPAVLAQS